ncbi:MAG: glutamate synthase large subunit, partial [Alphaproteobacteria bacterium]|nr:glutamate synthase large subunit [Alphaproteobacteria bacterium]
MALPPPQGLYDPRYEHDSCGVGFVADIKGRKSHDIVRNGLQIMLNLEHRGAIGSDPLMGDGAGVLVQIPHDFLSAEVKRLGFVLPPPENYGVGQVFLPRDAAARAHFERVIESAIAAENQTLLGWRDVPIDNSMLSANVKKTEPVIRQVFVGRDKSIKDTDSFERRLYIIRKVIRNSRDDVEAGAKDFYVCSLSARTVVYKGMLMGSQLVRYYRDLADPRFISALALVHQRFSTNTFPSWRLAHPYRMVCHNGEINTVRGNVNWMAARHHSMKSDLFGSELEKLWPLIHEGQSDTASLDNALELLVRGGYSLAHAMMMLIPEAWENHPLMDEKRRAFYEYHAALIEPWDGPAAIAFSDGRQIGATLDRNGLRPARYLVTDDGMVVMASEMGVLDIPEEKIVKKWRLQPGRMFLLDLEKGRIIDDAELKNELANARPYKEWLGRTQIKVEEIPGKIKPQRPPPATLLDRQQAFGYTQEDINLFLRPMVEESDDPIGSMGTDTPPAALSLRSKLLFTYFKQNFAQVTNPAIDSTREYAVMSLVSMIGPRPNLLGFKEDGGHWRLEVEQPILTNAMLGKIRRIQEHGKGTFRTKTLDITYPAVGAVSGMEPALRKLCDAAHHAVREGYNILILSDRAVGPDRIPIPSLLATSAVHHHLIRLGERTATGLVVETGEAREVHHFCCLAGYGAEAINPYLALETLWSLRSGFPTDLSWADIRKHYIKAIGKGMLKVIAKMGISTYRSYCGAQIFDAIGLSSEFIDEYFTGTATRVEGLGIKEVAAETVMRHRAAYGDAPIYRTLLDVGGDYAYRIRGEDHVWNPQTIAKLQHAVRANAASTYKDYAQLINDQSERLLTLRGLFDFNWADKPVPIEEVEPAKEIVKRFATGAMSFGSISREAHTTLAIAMNRIGGKSNTGEGGEEADRFKTLPNGDSMRSAIKQVASGRFGVTAEYLVNADQLQIKIAQGAKPGEGGQLPGRKVSGLIAKVRYSTPGVGLISPPPHHDIYSIEDLAQLIFDLKNANPQASISVKLVSEIGVGTVAAGVVKARADHITISGYEGGTGASPLTSLTHAGSPWEIGLAETHQTLVLNGLRGRSAVQVDGGLRTGRDVAIGALLGADEFGFATAPLIATGCIMMRKCHLNTCPVGIATQDPELRKRFTGKPEHVVNYFFLVAEELREIMAKLGVRTVTEMIGHTEKLNMHRATHHWKAHGINLARLIYRPTVTPGTATHKCEEQHHPIEHQLDHKLIELARPALEEGRAVEIAMPITNRDRTFGAMLSGVVARKFGHGGLAEDMISIKVNGSAGQSFGAWGARGLTFELEGDANDYIGKGLSGARIAVFPPRSSKRIANENIIVGNTVLYGAIAGEFYASGVAGERFAVRNSGAIAVVEGVGDHGCEYMTGGIAVVLGPTGQNFAAGMSGGIAYVYDPNDDFERRCNLAMVEIEPLSRGQDAGAVSDGALLSDITTYERSD